MERIAPAHVDSPFEFEFAQPAQPAAAAAGARARGCRLRRPRGARRRARSSLAPGDRIGLLGRNGAGKSTLTRVLAGVQPLMAGTRTAAQDLAIGYFAQHQLEQLDPGRDAARAPERFGGAALAARRRAGAARVPRRLRLQRRPRVRAGGAVLGRREGAARARADRVAAAEPAAARRADQPPRPRDAPRARHGAAGLRRRDRARLARPLPAAGSSPTSCGWSPTARARPFDGDLDDYAGVAQDRARGGGAGAARRGAPPRRAARVADRERKRREAEQRQRLRPLKAAVERARARSLETLGAEAAADRGAARRPRSCTCRRRAPSSCALLARQGGAQRREVRAAEEAWLEASEALEAARPAG